MEKATPTTSITLTLPGAARLLGVSETLARQMARAGRFPGAFQLGRAWRVHRQTFDEEVARLARGLPLEHVEDQILSRALDGSDSVTAVRAGVDQHVARAECLDLARAAGAPTLRR
jgi:excisionase family DNA binding protein